MIIALQREASSCRATSPSVRPSRSPTSSTTSPTQQEVLAIAEKWRPYRSLATSYLFSAAFERTEAPPVVPHET